MSETFTHRPVLLNECIQALNIRPDGIYLDGTLGRAGHSREIARRLPHGRYEQAAGAGHAVNKDRPGAVVRALQTVAMMKPPV